MNIHVRDSARLVVLSGRLDVVSVADVRNELHAAIDDGTGDLYLDASGIEAIDASGLGVLVGAHRRAGRAGRRFVLAAPSPIVSRMLHLTRLDRVLYLSETVPVVLTAPPVPLAVAG